MCAQSRSVLNPSVVKLEQNRLCCGNGTRWPHSQREASWTSDMHSSQSFLNHNWFNFPGCYSKGSCTRAGLLCDSTPSPTARGEFLCMSWMHACLCVCVCVCVCVWNHIFTCLTIIVLYACEYLFACESMCAYACVCACWHTQRGFSYSPTKGECRCFVRSII